MKIMNLPKDRETQQQSYFYVVWPEDKSPGTSVAATAALSNIAVQSSATNNSTASSSTTAPSKYDSQTITASSSSGNCSTSSLQQGSPVRSPLSKETAESMASEQVMTSTNATLSQETNTKLSSGNYSHGNSVKSQAAMSSKNSVMVSSTFVLPPIDSFTATNSPMGRQRTPDLSPYGRSRVHCGVAGSRGGETNLQEIGVLAKQAIVNLQKIVLVTGSPQSGINTGTSNHSVNKEFPPSKRRRAWDQSSSNSCMECEVKDAEINILRRRIQTMQERIEKVTLPNGNVAFQSHMPPPAEDRVSQIKTLVGQLQEASPQLTEQQQPQVLVQQYQGVKTSKSASVVLSSDTKPPEQSSSSIVANESGEYVELVDGSGVFISAYKLEEATRDAKTGTQLARKLMDAFWDKDTLARSTLTPRSKFQYQQLDPKVIKSIEDIHATMTDKCCQARSRYRSLNPIQNEPLNHQC